MCLTVVINTVLYLTLYSVDMVLLNVASALACAFFVVIHSFKPSLIRILVLLSGDKYFIHGDLKMSVFVIADLHLATANSQKSMEVFGKRWKNYIERIKCNWQAVVSENDTVIIPGDISWGLATKDALNDLLWLDALPGKKVIMKGNHDFWWSTVSKLTAFFKEHNINSIEILNNNALEIENYIIAGSRGWFTDKSMQNTEENVDYEKIVNREAIRLKMSLDAALKLKEKSEREIIVFLHFPPIWGDFVCKPIIDLLLEYKISRCYFGHIHGNYTFAESFEYDSIRFFMISADFLDFLPRII